MPVVVFWPRRLTGKAQGREGGTGLTYGGRGGQGGAESLQCDACSEGQHDTSARGLIVYKRTFPERECDKKREMEGESSWTRRLKTPWPVSEQPTNLGDEAGRIPARSGLGSSRGRNAGLSGEEIGKARKAEPGGARVCFSREHRVNRKNRTWLCHRVATWSWVSVDYGSEGSH